jgi:hypothetical protein
MIKDHELTVGYQNRFGVYGDLPITPKIIISNKLLKDLCKFSVGDKLKVHYFPDSVVLLKSNLTNICQK